MPVVARYRQKPLRQASKRSRPGLIARPFSCIGAASSPSQTSNCFDEYSVRTCHRMSMIPRSLRTTQVEPLPTTGRLLKVFAEVTRRQLRKYTDGSSASLRSRAIESHGMTRTVYGRKSSFRSGRASTATVSIRILGFGVSFRRLPPAVASTGCADGYRRLWMTSKRQTRPTGHSEKSWSGNKGQLRLESSSCFRLPVVKSLTSASPKKSRMPKSRTCLAGPNRPFGRRCTDASARLETC